MPVPAKLGGKRARGLAGPGLARFFQAISKHRKALDLAIEENFGGQLGPAEWRSAFQSAEPHDANRTMVVTGDHSAVLNAYIEILEASAGSRLIGVLPWHRPNARNPHEQRKISPLRPIRPDDCKAGALPAELWPQRL